MHMNMLLSHTCQVTQDISSSPIESQWGSWKYPGYNFQNLGELNPS